MGDWVTVSMVAGGRATAEDWSRFVAGCEEHGVDFEVGDDGLLRIEAGANHGDVDRERSLLEWCGLAYRATCRGGGETPATVAAWFPGMAEAVEARADHEGRPVVPLDDRAAGARRGLGPAAAALSRPIPPLLVDGARPAAATRGNAR